MRRALLLSVLAALIIVPATLAAGSPSVQTGGTQLVKDNSATLLGSVNPNGQPTKYAFKYGTTNQYGQETALTAAGNGTAPVIVSASITGLTAGTAYHYQIIAIGADGSTATGTDATFKTTGTAPPPPPPKPTATTGLASAVSPAGATVSGSVNPAGITTSYYFEFGTTAAYGFQTPPAPAGAGTANVSVAATLAGLQSGQTYHYRLVAVNLGGIALGSDATFKTTIVPSRFGLFGHTGFVSPQGVAGVFVACIGQSSCTGSLTITRGGQVLGQRQSFFVAAGDGGFVHLQLNSAGQSLLATRHHVPVDVSVSGSGQPTSGGVTLVQFR
jgi:hypothetical protein